MKIELDKYSGFCFGVIRAIRLAEKELKNSNKILYSLGDIVHNGREVERLEKLGLKSITRDEYLKLRDCKVLIRAHGEPPETYQYAANNNIELIDATCPVVLNLQKKISISYKRCTRNNGQIVIYGKRGHAEVVGLEGQTGNNALIVENCDDVYKIDFNRPVCLYSQTTKGVEDFYKIAGKIKANMKPGVYLEINDTICRQVSNRVPRLREFAIKYDIILFVAGQKSSNGRFLYHICKDVNTNTHYVSRVEDIDPEWFRGAGSVGISGATSTPDWVIQEIAARVEEISCQ
jgi:4-hydroxy-3-methylbut-2-en-1-yl diphosphate reductase